MRSDLPLSARFVPAALFLLCACASTPPEVGLSGSNTATATLAAAATMAPMPSGATPSAAPPPPSAAACAEVEAPNIPPAPNLEPHAIALELVEKEGTDPAHPTRVLAPATLSAFPALSEDGRWLALAANDEADFSADLVVRLRIVALPSGRALATYVFADEGAEYSARTPTALAAYERATRRALEQAQAQLDQKRWIGLERAYVPAETRCVAGPWTLFDASRTLDVDRVRRFERAALELELAADKDRLTVRTAEGGRIDARTLPVSFPAMGRSSEGGCGGVYGFRDAWIAQDQGTVVLAPHPSLGGDNCVGHLGLDQTVVMQL